MSECFTIKTSLHEYTVNSAMSQGDLSSLYSGRYIADLYTERYIVEDGLSGDVVIKIIDDPSDNDFMQNEIRTLKLLNSKKVDQGKHLPVLIDQFKTKRDQLGIVLEKIDGYDFYSIKKKYKQGIPEKHMVWMLSRLLSTLAYVHSRGIIHGNIDPTHIMIRPRDHNGWLIDWSYAVIDPKNTGDKFKIFNEGYSAPEVLEGKSPIPSADLYSLGKCMIFILGGDIKTNTMPDVVDVRIQRFLQFFVRQSPIQRAQHAEEMYKMLHDLIVELWGPKKFLEFEM